MKLKELIKKEKEFTDRILRPWQQWLFGILFFLSCIGVLVLYILYREGLL